MTLTQPVLSIFEYLSLQRESLHAIPERSCYEIETQKYIALELTNLGYKSRTINTGVYCDIVGKDKSRTIAIRCDMDALPIVENTNRVNKSTYPSMMHACGHDGHMSMVLALAKILTTNTPKCNVRLIFQYGEEGSGGSEGMIDGGVLKGVDEIFAVHMCPELPCGTIATIPGALFAGCVEFDISVLGQSCHCSDITKGIDALNSSVWIYNNIQTANNNCKSNSLLFIGSLNSGTASNIVSDKAKMEVTFRYHNQDNVDSVMMNIARILTQSDNLFGTTHQLHVKSVYPSLINSTKSYNNILAACPDTIDCLPRYTAEDFAFYLQHIDGCMAWLGCRGSKEYYPLHSDKFDFDNQCLLYGVQLYCNLVNKMI